MTNVVRHIAIKTKLIPVFSLSIQK